MSCQGFPVSEACPLNGKRMSDLALHDTDGKRLCDKCYIAFLLDKIAKLEANWKEPWKARQDLIDEKNRAIARA